MCGATNRIPNHTNLDGVSTQKEVFFLRIKVSEGGQRSPPIRFCGLVRAGERWGGGAPVPGDAKPRFAPIWQESRRVPCFSQGTSADPGSAGLPESGVDRISAGGPGHRYGG